MPNVNDIPPGLAIPTRTILVPAALTTLTLTAALHGNSLILLQSTAGLAITPPAATGTLNTYTFLCITAISGGSVTIDPKAGSASDVIGGVCTGGTTGSAATCFVTAANSNLITWNATTTGGLMGTMMWMVDVATNKWVGWMSYVTSGTAATPFSNH